LLANRKAGWGDLSANKPPPEISHNALRRTLGGLSDCERAVSGTTLTASELLPGCENANSVSLLLYTHLISLFHYTRRLVSSLNGRLGANVETSGPSPAQSLGIEG